MERPLHHRAFVVSVVWTLALLFLGSVVHATGSSLACPDWPTCYGTMVPEMTGGIFWEHLHRLVAGGLVLMWTLAIYLSWEPGRERRWLRWATLGGLVLLLIQAVLGGVTVILELPDAVSTSHLGLAFLFLILAAVLAVATSPRWGGRPTPGEDARRAVRAVAVPAAGLVFVQSLLGAWVRHADAGMACPGIPLCLGEWIPSLARTPILLQWSHRALAVVTGLAVLALVGVVLARTRTPRFRRGALAAGVLVVLQIALGFVSVTTVLDVVPVSLHTLVAATLLAVTSAVAAWTWEPGIPDAAGPRPSAASGAGSRSGG